MAQEPKTNVPKAQSKPQAKANEPINIVRIAGRDINGKYTIEGALRQIKGISHNMASAMAMLAEKQYGITRSTTIGSLEEKKLDELETVIKEPGKFGVPNYMLNRRKDSDTGVDVHFVGTDLLVKTRQDIDSTIKLQSWIGFRRQYGQKVRGQRTRSTGRTGETVGVTKKRIQEEAKKATKPSGQGAAAAGPAKEGGGAAPAAAPQSATAPATK